MNKIFHPNIDELLVFTFPGIPPPLLTDHPWVCRSGSVCLDVINQTWSPMFGKRARTLILTREIRRLRADKTHRFYIDMINIFEVFLPQLLRYPNPNDPLNGEAAALLMRHPAEYDAKVKGKWKVYSRALRN